MPKFEKEIVIHVGTALPASPPVNYVVLYADTDGKLYSKDAGGNVYPVSDALDEALFWASL